MQVNVLTDYFGKDTPIIEEACKFYGSILIHPRTLKNVILDIEVDPKLRDMGECINEDDTKKSRYFTIVLRCADDDDDPYRTLAHEMVHVKQFIKNELGHQLVVSKNGFKSALVWRGEVWNPKKNEHPYFDSPSEVEAYGKEVGLFHRWNLYYNEKYS